MTFAVAQELLANWMARQPHIPRVRRNSDALNRSRNAHPAQSYAEARRRAIVDGHRVKYEVPR